jgi:predicted ATPase
VPALQHFEKAVSLYDQKEHHIHAYIYGLDPGVFCFGRIAWRLARLGHLDQALKKSEEALALAHRQAHPYSLAICILQVLPVLDCRCEWSAILQQAEAAIALCNEHGFGSLLARATIYRGYAFTRQRQTAEGFALMRQGLDAQFATGAMLFRPWYLSYLAEAYGIVERFEEGLASLAEAIATVERTRERLEEATLHRLKEDLMLLRPGIRVTSRDKHRGEVVKP